MDVLGKKLPFYVPYISDGRITNATGKQVRGWRNASIVKAAGEQKVDKELDETFDGF